MRALHQGAPRKRHRVADRGALADIRARRGRRTPRPQDLTRRRLGVILAGGASRRFGGAPKGLEVVGGMRVVDRVRAALAAVADEVVLSANAKDAAPWLPGVRIVRDAFPAAGGLAGVHAALMDDPDADVVAVAWDMPFVSAALLQALHARFVSTGADACVPESDSPYGMEPFCAWYAARLGAPLGDFLAAGGGSARAFLARCAVTRVTAEELRPFGDPRTLFLSVNDRTDLERARGLPG